MILAWPSELIFCHYEGSVHFVPVGVGKLQLGPELASGAPENGLSKDYDAYMMCKRMQEYRLCLLNDINSLPLYPLSTATECYKSFHIEIGHVTTQQPRRNGSNRKLLLQNCQIKSPNHVIGHHRRAPFCAMEVKFLILNSILHLSLK
jgi:hypothetical protein